MPTPALTPELLSHGDFFGCTTVRHGLGGIVLAEARYEPLIRLPRHAHASPYLCLVVGGSFDETSGPDRHECRAGTIVFHPADEDHADSFGSAGGRCFNVQLDARLTDRLREADELPARRVAITIGPGALVLASLREAAQAPQTADQLDELDVEAIALTVLAELGRATELSRGRSPPRWLARAVERLRSEIPTSIAEVARAEGVHPVHFTRVFRAYHRGTPAGYVRRVRLERACALMLRANVPLSAVAHDAGYSDQSHFCREFRRSFGASPSTYRRMFR